MSLCYTSTSEVTDNNEEACVLDLGRILASAFIEWIKIATDGPLKRVARTYCRAGHSL